MNEPFSARCRRVLENGPASPDDHEAARYLIDQGLADGRCGPPSKGRDNYGKITQVAWFGITPAGRLWLEQSANRKGEDGLDQAGKENRSEETEGRKHYRLARDPWLIVLAVAVAGTVLASLVNLLLKTHLGIPL